MKTVKYVLASFMLIISMCANAQTSTKVAVKPNTKKKITLTSQLDRISHPGHVKPNSIIKQRSIFNAKKLPIFCKMEHKIAKSSNVNVMMRLGSLDYVNKLEGKTPNN